MRPLALCLALCLPAAGPPQPPPPITTDPAALRQLAATRPDRTLDPVLDAGAIPGPAGARPTRLALQACLDAAAQYGDPIRVVVPSGLFSDRPLLLPSGAFLDGRNVGSIRFGSSAGLIAGVPRAPRGVAVDPADLVDSTQFLDGSIRDRRGVRLAGHQTIAEFGGPFSALANWWRDAAAITIDLAYRTEPADSARTLSVGWSDGPEAHPANAVIDHAKGEAAIYWGGKAGVAVPRWVKVTDARLKDPGTHRVAFQLDVASARVLILIDGKAYRPAVSGWSPDPSARLLPHNRTPFKVGGGGVGPASVRPLFGPGGPAGGTVLGCRVQAGVRYDWDAIDTPKRLDGRPINDALTYWEWSGDSAALDLSDDPADVARDRSLRIMAPTSGSALLLDAAHAQSDATSDNRIEGLRIQADGGDAVQVGSTLGLRIADCRLAGRGCGLGGLRMGANYYHDFRSLSLDGGEYCGFLDLAMFRLDRVDLGPIGRSGLRLVRCYSHVSHLFAGWTKAGAESFVRVEGGSLRLRDATFDMEGGGGGLLGIVDATTEGAADTQAGVLVDVDWINLGVVPKGASVFRLRSSYSPLIAPGVLRLGTLTTSSGGRAGATLVDVDDAGRWGVRVDHAGSGLDPARWPVVGPVPAGAGAVSPR